MSRTSSWVPWLAAAVLFAVGLMAGGYGPRREVRALQQQVFELERQLAAVERPNPGRELAELLSKGMTATPGTPAPTPERTRNIADPADVVVPDAVKPPAPPIERRTPEASLEEQQAFAREAMVLRRTQARAALIEDARPSVTQLDAIDAAVSDMNQELLGLIGEVASVVSVDGTPTRRDTMVFGLEALDVLVAAEDRMLDALDPEQRASIREETTDPLSYLDPAVIDAARNAVPER